MLPVLLAAVVFAPHPGWQTGRGPVHACIGVAASRCQTASSWAGTIALRDCPNCLPHRTLAVLPRQGIVLQITVGVERSGFHPPAAHWPLRVRPSEIVAGGEGIPPTIGVVQRAVRVGRLEVFVWVFFGRPHPTSGQLERANAELARAKLPGLRPR